MLTHKPYALCLCSMKVLRSLCSSLCARFTLTLFFVSVHIVYSVKNSCSVLYCITNPNAPSRIRLSYNMTSADCAGAVFYSMMKLAVKTPHSSASKYL